MVLSEFLVAAGMLFLMVAYAYESPRPLELEQPPLEQRIAIIAGTSCCHLAQSSEPVYVDGVWGPFFSVALPGFYTTEGGQVWAASYFLAGLFFILCSP
jgi:ribulose kinase